MIATFATITVFCVNLSKISFISIEILGNVPCSGFRKGKFGMKFKSYLFKVLREGEIWQYAGKGMY